MQAIDLLAVPNQSFSISLNGRFWNIVIKEINGVMCSTITRNNVVLQSGMIIPANFALLPYRFQEDGNFIITSLNNEIPYYTQFNISQFLFFATQDEIVSARLAAGV